MDNSPKNDKYSVVRDELHIPVAVKLAEQS